MITCLLAVVLIVVLLIACVFAILALVIGGTAGMFMFGYEVLCIIIIVWIVKKIRNRKHR